MRISILTKFLALVLFLSVVPLAVSGFMSVRCVEGMKDQAITYINDMKEVAIVDSTESLSDLGELMIKQTAEDVAKQLGVYIRENPYLTVADLQSDEYFSALAVQPVGETGYTAVHDVETIINRFHVNSAIVDMDLHDLEESLPAFYELISENQGGNEVEGYYDWEDEDGGIRSKYMYIAVVDEATADGVNFGVAATTYIDEFSMPVLDMDEVLETHSVLVQTAMDQVAAKLRLYAMAILIIMIVLVVIFSALFTATITAPIKKLRAVVRRVADGDFRFRAEIETDDEVGDLAVDFSRMTEILSEQRKSLEDYSKHLEEKIKDRTKRLEEINKVTVGRELEMVKMKKEMDQLKKKLNKNQGGK